MNSLDIILVALIIIFSLTSNYKDFQRQSIRLASIFFAIFFSIQILQNLIVFFFPIIGYTKTTKPMLYYLSIFSIYIIISIVINLIVYRYESAKKNDLLNSYIAPPLSILNSILILSIIISIIMNSAGINKKTMSKLNESKIFHLLYQIDESIIDYE